MESVEIPTIYFTPPGIQPDHTQLYRCESEFWNTYSQANSSKRRSSHLITQDLCGSNVSVRNTGVSGESSKGANENEPQPNRNEQNSIKAKIIPVPHQRRRSVVKLKLEFEWHQVFLLISLVTLSLFCQVSEECPTACECKWKSGKESVLCANANSKLTSIPTALDPGTQLLDLSRNNVQVLKAKVFHSLNLLNLQKIFLPENNLRVVEKNAFFKLNNLVELDLSGNALSAVPSHAFDQIPELRELKINSNPITRITGNAFSSLTRLVRLDLSRCRIGALDPNAFRGLLSLESLKLDNNRLLMVQVVSFYSLRNLHGLELHGNPWNCSCTLQPLRDWMSKNNVPYGVPPVCSEPRRLSGKSWDQLQREDFACLPKVQSQSSVLAETGELTKAIEGENATLVCRLQATADTKVRWMNGNKPVVIPSTGSPKYSLSESFTQGLGEGEKVTTMASSNGGKLALGTKTSKLTVIKSKLRDSGVYSCKAETRAGSVSANFTLQVLKLNAEQLTNRFVLYGATVAALLTLSICLLLLFVVFYCGKQKSRVITEDKIELNHIGQNGRLPVNGHRMQNGGTTIPLLQSESHAENNVPNSRPKGLTAGLLNNLKKSGQGAANSSNGPNTNGGTGLLNKKYKALPLNDRNVVDDEVDPDYYSGGEDSERVGGSEEDLASHIPCRNNPKVLSVNLPDTSAVSINPSEHKFPDLINGKKSATQTQCVKANEDYTKTDEPQNQSTISLISSGRPSVPPHSSGTIRSSEPHSNSIPKVFGRTPPVKPPPPMSLSSSHRQSEAQPPSTTSNGGINYGSYPMVGDGSSNNSSISNISRNESPYGSTMTYQTTLSTPPTFTKFTFTQKHPQPPPVAPRHKRTSSFSNSPNTESAITRQLPTPPPRSYYMRDPFHHHYALQNQRGPPPPYQRRSMPTSPIHYPSTELPIHPHNPTALYNGHAQGLSDPVLSEQGDPSHPQEYDYHAAQLASFLEEYRHLQMELMRMSASLTEMEPSSAPQSSTPNNINAGNKGNSIEQGSPAGPRNANNVNSDHFHPQHLKSFLQSSGPNNNYLV